MALPDLEEPLLRVSETDESNDKNCQDDDADSTGCNRDDEQHLPRALAILVFAMGATVGLMSQLLLEMLVGVWQESIKGQSVAPFQHFLFSMGLASLLCLIVVGAEYLIPLLRGAWMELPTSSSSSSRDFLIGQEAWSYATGAAFSICGFWISVELWRIPLPLSSNILLEAMSCTVSVFSVLYVILLPINKVPCQNHTKEACQSSFHRIIAVGLLSGAVSQLIPFTMVSRLAYWFASVHSQSMIFSICWGISTVMHVAGGLWIIKKCFPHHLSASFHSIYNAECFFIACSLLGVAVALIFLDVCFGMTRQLLPSLSVIVMNPFFLHFILSADSRMRCEEDDKDDDNSSLESDILDEDNPTYGSRLDTRQQQVLPVVY